MDCSKYIEKKACVQAKVRVCPKADAGEVEFVCIGEPKREPCPETLCGDCDFMISQMMCLRIPIRFSAQAAVVETGIVCEKGPQDCEPHGYGDMRGYQGVISRKNLKESKQNRSFDRNYLLTYQNNSEPT